MKISCDLFRAFLKCSTKCWLRAAGEAASGNAYAEWAKSQNGSYHLAQMERLLSETARNEVAASPPPEKLKAAKWRLAINLAVRARMNTWLLESEVHAVERTRSEGPGRPMQFIPIRFIFTNKLSEDDKLLLAFDTFVLSEATGREIRFGKIIHGDDHSPLKVKTAARYGEVRKCLEKIAALLSSPRPPELVLNPHCGECEFQNRCRQKAIEVDDLSLLAGMSHKERNKFRSKGIFTVTQLSYTFRPRRRPKRIGDKREKYHHSLKALAIREKKIHIVGRPELKIDGTPIYFDVEGLPDRDFYYLIGIRIGTGDSAVHHSLWADTAADEGRIWRDFLAMLETVEKPVLIHYGSYETAFFKRMRERYSNRFPALVGQLIAKAVNLLSIIYAHVYFPTYSNTLKEIGAYVGFRWSATSASGLSTLIWRSQFEQSQEAAFKERLITYNAEDCQALQMVAETVWKVLDRNQAGQSGTVDVSTLKREYPERFGSADFLLPEFKAINEAAYWDYQRSRIYIRTDRGLSKPYRRREAKKNQVRPNEVVRAEHPRPDCCPHCAATLIYKWGTLSQTVYNLRFTSAGIRRWVVRFVFQRFICWQCKRPFQFYTQKPKYGPGLFAYVLYQMFEMGVSQNAIAVSLSRLFGLPFSRGGVNHLKESAAAKYRTAYDDILRRIVSGKLIHADETKANVEGREGYVWVFTSLEEVAFVYRPTREAEFVHEMLKTFTGVLVSDYFSGYDAIPCAQQKCLIHLMRDINDDLRKYPFNQEMREIAEMFAGLLRPMVASVDRFGLKARHLRKHRPGVEKFFCDLERRDYQTEVAVAYRTRFERNRNKLFTFLDYDGVPWNNNNAEHAIKAFVRLRRSMGGTSTVKGMEEYLVLLSISETCKAKGVDALEFYLSSSIRSRASEWLANPHTKTSR
jgi:predicted RecB family nuclease